MNFHYPVTLDVTDKKCTIVGGGQVAARKASKLLQAGARVYLISPELCPQLKQLELEGRLQWVPRCFREEDLSGSWLVIAATADRAVNTRVAQSCREQNILVNVIDSPEESSFIVNASLQRGDLLLAVSTNGQNPALAQKIRSELESNYGPAYAEVLQILNEARVLLREKVVDTAERGRIMKELLDSEIIELIIAGDVQQAREKVQACISIL